VVMHSMFMAKGEDWKSRALAAEGRLANAATTLEKVISIADALSDELSGGRFEGVDMDRARETLSELLPDSPHGASQAELDATKNAIDTAARNLAAQLDEVIKEGIGRILGGAQWTLASLAGRLTRLTFQGNDDVTWALDGVPFLVTRDTPPTLDSNLICTFRFEYRFLFPPVGQEAPSGY
jgi:hypothetical protein